MSEINDDVPVKRKRGRPAKVYDRKYKVHLIDPLLNEELFRLWLSGKTFNDIVRLYTTDMTKNQKFSLDTLKEAAEEYKWEERRKELTEQVMRMNNDQIIIDKQKQLSALSMIIDMNLTQVESAYKEYLKSPKKFLEKAREDKSGAFWLIKDMTDLKGLFDYYKKMTAPDVVTEEGLIQGGGLSFVQNVMIPQQNNTTNVSIKDNNLCFGNNNVRGKFFDLIKHMADAKVSVEMGQDPKLLEAEKKDDGNEGSSS